MDIETKGKKRGSPKFNAFDVVIILVLLLVVIIPIVLAIRAEQESNAPGTKEDIVYRIKIDDIDVETIGKIAKKQNVTDAATGKVIGTVYAISGALPYKNYARDEEGKVEASIDENGSYLVLTIKATAVYNDTEGYTVQGERIAVGKVIDLRLPNFEATGVCTALHN